MKKLLLACMVTVGLAQQSYGMSRPTFGKHIDIKKLLNSVMTIKAKSCYAQIEKELMIINAERLFVPLTEKYREQLEEIDAEEKQTWQDHEEISRALAKCFDEKYQKKNVKKRARYIRATYGSQRRALFKEEFNAMPSIAIEQLIPKDKMNRE